MRFGLGSVLGAGAAGAYGFQQLKEAGPSPSVWSILPGNWGSSMQSTVSSSPEVAALQNELRRLTGMMGDMARRESKPTVVHVGGQGRGGWTFLIVPLGLTGAGVYVYCRITGRSIWDLLYVSRSSLTALTNTVQESFARVWDEMRRQKDEIVQFVGSVIKKQEDLSQNQDQLMAKQDQMDEQLRAVKDITTKLDEKADQLDAKADHTIQQAQALDNRLTTVHNGVIAANEGIFMLVNAVSEVTQKIGLHNSRATKQLKQYADRGPAWGADATRQLPSATWPAGTQENGLEGSRQLPAITAPPTAGTQQHSGASSPLASESLIANKAGGIRAAINSFRQSGPLPSTSSQQTPLPRLPDAGSAMSMSGPLPSGFSIREEPAEKLLPSAASTTAIRKMDSGLRTLGF